MINATKPIPVARQHLYRSPIGDILWITKDILELAFRTTSFFFIGVGIAF